MFIFPITVDRCLSSPCPVNSNCTNYPTEYVCVCHEGYHWENEDCLGMKFTCFSHSAFHVSLHSYIPLFSEHFEGQA